MAGLPGPGLSHMRMRPLIVPAAIAATVILACNRTPPESRGTPPPATASAAGSAAPLPQTAGRIGQIGAPSGATAADAGSPSAAPVPSSPAAAGGAAPASAPPAGATA